MLILTLTQFSAAAAAPSFHSTTTPFDPSASVRFSYSSSTSMALTVVIFLLALFFIGCFSILIRRFFACVHSSATALQGPPLLLSTTTTHHHRRYLSPYPAGAAAVDPIDVHALPVLTYAGGAKEVAGCVVCLGEFEEKERVKVIPGCGHVFHPGCLDGWLVLSRSCPVCRCSELWGPGAGARNYREIWVGVDGGGTHATNSTADSDRDDEDEDGRKFAGPGRSKSFSSDGAGETAECSCGAPTASDSRELDGGDPIGTRPDPLVFPVK